MKVYVAGYKGAGFGGKLIKWFTFGGYSHVSFVFDFGDRREELDALQGRGVTARLDGRIKGDRDLFHVPCTIEQAFEIRRTACKLIGSKYDWRGIYGFLARRKRENKRKWFCSELVAHCLAENGYELCRLPAWKQSPVIVCSSNTLIPCK